MKEIVSVSSGSSVITTGTYTSDQDGSKVDVTGYRHISFLLTVDSYTDGTHDFTAQHAADDGTGSPDTWEDIPDKWTENSFPSVSGSSDTGVHLVGVVTNRMFVRVTTSVSGGPSTGATYGVNALLQEGRFDNAGANPASSEVGLQ